MKNVRYQRLLRLATRSLELTQAPNPHPTVALAGEPLPAAFQEMQQSFRALRALDEMVSILASRSRQAMKTLRQEFDNARVMVSCAHVEAARFEASSQFLVPEDFLESAQELLGVVDHLQQHAWAAQIAPTLKSALDLAIRSREEELTSRASLQKAQAQAREKADALEAVLVELRYAVRAVFGSKSREYQLIRAVRNHGNPDEQQTPIIELPTSKDNTPGQKVA